MPAFVKTPRFILSAIFLLWLIFVIYKNYDQAPVFIWYFPVFGKIQVRLLWALIDAAVFGAILTLVVQWLWTHRSSKKASASVAA